MVNLATRARGEKMEETQRFHHITQSVLGKKRRGRVQNVHQHSVSGNFRSYFTEYSILICLKMEKKRKEGISVLMEMLKTAASFSIQHQLCDFFKWRIILNCSYGCKTMHQCCLAWSFRVWFVFHTSPAWAVVERKKRSIQDEVRGTRCALRQPLACWGIIPHSIVGHDLNILLCMSWVVKWQNFFFGSWLVFSPFLSLGPGSDGVGPLGHSVHSSTVMSNNMFFKQQTDQAR